MAPYRDDCTAARLRIVELERSLSEAREQLDRREADILDERRRRRELEEALGRTRVIRVIERDHGLGGWLAAASLAVLALVAGGHLWMGRHQAERKMRQLGAQLEASQEVGASFGQRAGSAERSPSEHELERVIPVEYPVSHPRGSRAASHSARASR